MLKRSSIVKKLKREYKGVKKYVEEKFGHEEKVNRKGKDLLHYPLNNKSNGFTYEERERLNLKGLLPAAKFTLEQQSKLYLDEFREGDKFEIDAKEKNKNCVLTPEKIRQFLFMQNLMYQNEVLFYKILVDKFEEIAPIIYTPTVGWFCKNFSRNFKRQTGLFVSYLDKGRIPILISNLEQENVDAIVVTDGSRILGIGDQGVGGMGISIGKMNLYVAGGGFSPKRILPVLIDVGTNNQNLLNDPYYLGMRCNRIDGEQYFELIDEFVACVYRKWPKALIQFEDFEFRKAFKLLEKYRDEFLVFNDDIQGTAAIVLAALLGALKNQGKASQKITEQIFVIVGAGGSGRGIMTVLKDFLMRFGLTEEEALSKFFIVDTEGLLTKRPGLDDFIEKFARNEVEFSKLNLLDVVRLFKPTVLIGVSGSGGIFTPEILKAMNRSDSEFIPVILPLSSPVAQCECTAEDVFKYTDGKAIFGSGVPFPDVNINGQIFKPNFINNAYIYPGLSFGSFLSSAKIISDRMILAAAEALSNMLTLTQIKEKRIFPELNDIREISVNIAAKVIEQASLENNIFNEEAEFFLNQSPEDLKKYIRRMQWTPSYDHTPI